MKKKYIKPSIVVEMAVLPAVMDDLSAGRIEFGGGSGDADGGGGDGEFIIEGKYGGFGSFGSFDDDEY